jgi:hypothetical protein
VQFLTGKKTFILSIVGGIVVNIAYQQGWISREMWESLTSFCLFGTAATNRIAIKKVEDKV